MITAAAVSNLPVLRMRPFGRFGLSPSLPRTSGITATPVSKPESPSASRGNRISDTAIIWNTFPCSCVRASCQSEMSEGWLTILPMPTAITMALRTRYVTTRPTAIPIASVKPLRKTAPSSAIRNSVTPTWCPSSNSGAKGFPSTWAEASAAESVIVMMKSVATKPSRTSTKSLPCHQVSSRSSMPMESSP